MNLKERAYCDRILRVDLAGGEPQALLRLAGRQTGNSGILLGWLDEMAGGETNWLRLRPGEDDHDDYIVVSAETLFATQFSHIRISDKELEAKD